MEAMSKRINLTLSSKSFEEGIKEVRRYQVSVKKKAKLIQDRVTELLKLYVKEGFNGARYDDLLINGFSVPVIRVFVDERDNVSIVIAKGKEAVFIEFGAGVYYNPGGSAHPNRPPGIVQIGEYGKGHGKQPVWAFTQDGKTYLTHGTPASMPMYYAVKAIVEEIPNIVRDIFQK